MGTASAGLELGQQFRLSVYQRIALRQYVIQQPFCLKKHIIIIKITFKILLCNWYSNLIDKKYNARNLPSLQPLSATPVQLW